LYEDRLSRFYALKDSYDQANLSLNTKIADAYIITPAQVPDKKYSPKRAVIILVTMISAFIISCFIVIATDRMLQIKKEYFQ
jgi:uncharacterized protein involved in exopolysaccharide biosynthesis